MCVRPEITNPREGRGPRQWRIQDFSGTTVLHYNFKRAGLAQGLQTLLAVLRLNYKSTAAWRTSVSTISIIRKYVHIVFYNYRFCRYTHPPPPRTIKIYVVTQFHPPTTISKTACERCYDEGAWEKNTNNDN